jgi:hypothetical protein
MLHETTILVEDTLLGTISHRELIRNEVVDDVGLLNSRDIEGEWYLITCKGCLNDTVCIRLQARNHMLLYCFNQKFIKLQISEVAEVQNEIERIKTVDCIF